MNKINVRETRRIIHKWITQINFGLNTQNEDKDKKNKTQHRNLKTDPIRRLGEFIYYQDDVGAIMLFVFITPQIM
jgi:hypothetical protein